MLNRHFLAVKHPATYCRRMLHPLELIRVNFKPEAGVQHDNLKDFKKALTGGPTGAEKRLRFWYNMDTCCHK